VRRPAGRQAPVSHGYDGDTRSVTASSRRGQVESQRGPAGGNSTDARRARTHDDTFSLEVPVTLSFALRDGMHVHMNFRSDTGQEMVLIQSNRKLFSILHARTHEF
jgi:hypothetical protein